MTQRTVKLVLEYDGTSYHGWQKQPCLPTIQGILEGAVSRITKTETPVTGAGRTDAGVHALRQVAHLKTTLRMEPHSWCRALNSLLPPDIVILTADFVSDDFHARYSALSKIYEYSILNQPTPSAILRTMAWHIPRPLDPGPMQEAGRHLLGTHDFSSFRAAECGAKDPKRTLRRLEIRWGTASGHLPLGGDPAASPSLLILTFEAQSFLHHMVRNLVGTLVEIGRGKHLPQEMLTILNARNRRLAGPTAPAHGLWLMDVSYPIRESCPPGSGF